MTILGTRVSVVFIVLAFIAIASSCDDTGDAVRRIPGTELASTNQTSITISPYEEWLLLWEWTVSPHALTADSDSFEHNLVSFHIPSQARVLHALDNIPPGSIRVWLRKRPWEFGAWHAIHTDYELAGWDNDGFHVDLSRSSQGVLVVPGVPSLQMIRDRQTAKTCSDRPPADAVRAHLKGHIYQTQAATVAWSNGTFSDRVYFEDKSAEGRWVAVHQPDGSKKRLVQKHSRFKNISIQEMRVSPDESYLAYSTSSKIIFPIPLPDHREEVFILDLESGKEKRVGDDRYVGNMMWNRESSRLYFTSSGGMADGGVYFVDVRKLFN